MIYTLIIFLLAFVTLHSVIKWGLKQTGYQPSAFADTTTTC